MFVIVAVSGCASDTVEAATDSDISVRIDPIVMKESSTANVSVIITDKNVKCPVYAVSVRDITGLQLVERNVEGGILPGDTVKVEFRVKSPEMSNITNTTIKVAHIVTPEPENRVIMKELTVPVVLLPDVRFATAGLSADNSTAGTQNLEVIKGSNIYAVCSVKNFGKSNVDSKTLWVKAYIENPEIGGNASAWIDNSMTYDGISESKQLALHVDDNAPNGVTKVILQLKTGNYVIDEKQLSLRVKL